MHLCWWQIATQEPVADNIESVFATTLIDCNQHRPDPKDLVVIREGCVALRLEPAHHRLLRAAHKRTPHRITPGGGNSEEEKLYQLDNSKLGSTQQQKICWH